MAINFGDESDSKTIRDLQAKMIKTAYNPPKRRVPNKVSESKRDPEDKKWDPDKRSWYSFNEDDGSSDHMLRQEQQEHAFFSKINKMKNFTEKPKDKVKAADLEDLYSRDFSSRLDRIIETWTEKGIASDKLHDLMNSTSEEQQEALLEDMENQADLWLEENGVE